MSIALDNPAIRLTLRPTGDRVWRTVTWAAGITTMVVIGGVAVFLIIQGAPAVTAPAGALSRGSRIWDLTWPLLFGSAWVSFWALLIAAPIGIGASLYLTMVAPRRLGSAVSGAIDLLAAVPSVVYGLWGLFVVAPVATHLYAWLGAHLGWIPLFAGTPSATGRTALTAAVVLAIMVLPMITSLSREVISLVPRPQVEGVLALGGTRWQSIQMAVLPQARSGIIAGVLLALGRALGETMAVAMVLSSGLLISVRLITSENPGTVASFIAQDFPEASGVEVNALLWLGLMLFCLTMVINSLARAAFSRRAAK